MSDCTNCKDDCAGVVPNSFVLSEFSDSHISGDISVPPGQCVTVKAFRIRDTKIKVEIVERVCDFELIEDLVSCGSKAELGVHTGNEITFCKPGRYRFKAFENDGVTPVKVGIDMPVLVRYNGGEGGCGCGC